MGTTLVNVQGMWALELIPKCLPCAARARGLWGKRRKDFKSKQCLPGTTAMISMRTVVAAGIGPAQVPADRTPH